MIPLRDVIPSRTTPWITIALIAANLVVFVRELGLYDDPEALSAFFYTWGLVPAEFSWPSAFTSMFVHSGLLHVGLNLLSLWIFGDNVEDRLGHGRFLLFYLSTGLAATLAETWANPASPIPLIGASGAIAGVMGAYVVLFPRSRVLVLLPILIIYWEIIELPAALVLGVWFAMQILGGLARPADAGGGVAFWAHAGGFVAGVILGWPLRRRERERPDWWSA